MHKKLFEKDAAGFGAGVVFRHIIGDLAIKNVTNGDTGTQSGTRIDGAASRVRKYLRRPLARPPDTANVEGGMCGLGSHR